MVASARAVIVSGVLGVLLGAALTWLLIGARTTPGVPPDTPAMAEPRPGAADAPPVVAGAAPVATTLSGHAPSALRGGAIDRAAAAKALLDAVVVTLPPLVSGTIAGHVATEDGRPIAGVFVRARAYPPPQPDRLRGAPGTDLAPEEELEFAATNAKWGAATAREAVTDASGAYVLEGLCDAEYWLRAHADGYEIRFPRTAKSAAARPGDTVDFVATPVVSVIVSVLRPDGSPATEAMIRWTKPKKGGGGATNWRVGNPGVAMPPGEWSVYAEVGDEMRSPPVVVKAGTEASTVVLRLDGRNAILGKLRIDAADVAWPYAFLIAKRRGAPEGEKSLRADARPPDWSFRFEDVPAGEYEVSAGFTEGAPLATASVQVATGVASVSLAIPRLTSAEVLEVRAVGPDGAPLGEDEVQLSIVVRRGGGMHGVGARAGHRADGTLLVALVDPDAATRHNASLKGLAVPTPPPDKGPAQWVLQARWKGQSKEVEFDFGRTVRVDVRFE